MKEDPLKNGLDARLIKKEKNQPMGGSGGGGSGGDKKLRCGDSGGG